MAAAAGGGRAPRRPALLTPRGNGDRTVFLFDRRREQADPDEKVLSYGKDNYRAFRSAVCQMYLKGGHRTRWILAGFSMSGLLGLSCNYLRETMAIARNFTEKLSKKLLSFTSDKGK